MIFKDKKFKNKYVMDTSSTNEDFKNVCNGYNQVKCIICNRETANCFRPGLFGNNIVTINNSVPTGVFYVNGKF